MQRRTNGRARRKAAARRAAVSPRRKRILLGAAAASVILLSGFSALSFGDVWDMPMQYSSIEDHLKYGSTGSERTLGIPHPVFLALPRLFSSYLPGDTKGRDYRAFGFVYERGNDLPIGFSQREFEGFNRVGMNCAACHAGQVREAKDREARVFVGMPANTTDVGAFMRFLFQAAADERFTPERILAAIDEAGVELGPIERRRLQYLEIFRLRERLLQARHRLQPLDDQPMFGPGRTDMVTMAKALAGLGAGDRYTRWVGTVDFPSIWLQGKKASLSGYWDGSNDSMEERIQLGAVHTGAIGTVDPEALARMQGWLQEGAPPAYPYGMNESLLDEGAMLYSAYCADCHGESGRQFSDTRTRRSETTAITQVKTDPHRLSSADEDLLRSIRMIPGPQRFDSFKRSDGYANVPLDGIWLRAPYLHNGSVPTLRDLLEPSSRRPTAFYRGSDIYDSYNVGFLSGAPEQDGRKLFLYYTGEPGNSNRGHEGRRYGTQLSPPQKDALLEYLKTF
jgi:mono/diheme cytochrome c family protein